MKELIEKLKVELNKLGWDINHLLNHPYNSSELKAFLENELNMILSNISDFLDLYEWSDGMKMVENDIQKSYFSPHLFFNSIIDATTIYNEDKFYGFRKRKLFPVFQSFFGEYLTIDFVSGKLYYCSAYDYEIDTIEPMYDSLKSLIKTTIQFIKKGYIIVDTDGYLVENPFDYVDFLKTGIQENPESNYWIKKLDFYNTDNG